MNHTKLILGALALFAAVNAQAAPSSERVPLDFSIRLGMTSGTLTRQASASEDTPLEELVVNDYAGNPISLGINYDAGPDLTLGAELWLVAVGSSLLAEKGLFFTMAYHLMGGSRYIAEDMGFARIVRRNPFNLSFVSRVGYNLIEYANVDNSKNVTGAMFEVMMGIQFRQDIGENSAIALEYLMTMMSLPANNPLVTSKRTAILLSYRFFL